MIKHILLFVLVFCANSVFSQTPVVGKVKQVDGSPVEYFTVRFIADTVSLSSGSFIGGRFSGIAPNGVNIVEVSAWGFDSMRKEISACGDTLLFTLVNHQHELGEVDVVANKKNLKVDGNTFTLAVEGTSMAESANINDVLCRVPLLMVNEKNEVAMFGKDNVVVYVNNRRIKSKGELDNLNPQAIRDVKLINSPNSRYDADADAVISITTKDYYGTEITLRNIATKGRLFSDALNALLYLHQGSNTIHADYTLTSSNNKSYEGSIITNIEDEQGYNNDEETIGKYIGHSYSIAGEHIFNNEHKLSVQFVGWNDRSRPKVESVQEYYNARESSLVETSKKTKDNSDHYDVGAGYDFKLGQQRELSVSANYTNHHVETTSNIHEDLQLHDYDFDSKYNALDAQADYHSSMANGLNFDAGGKVSIVSNDSKSSFISSNTALESSFSYDYDFSERVIGMYIDFEKIVGDVGINAGLRVEHTDFEGKHNQSNVIDTTYYTFAPSLKLTYATKGKNKLTLSYRNTISRPSFSNLSPNIRYDNAFYYRRGNPSLLPTITSNVTLAWNMGSKFWMNIGYRNKHNATIYQYTEVDNGNAIEVIMSNHKNIHFLLASVGYNFNKGRFRSANSVSITKPFAKIALSNGENKIDRCAYYFKSINDFTISKHFSVNADFIYNDLGETLLEKKDAMFNLSVGATAYILKRSVALSVAANDILDTYIFKDHREFGSFNVDHRYNPDNTYVRFTIRYIFNSGKTKKIQAVNSNSQTVDRM